MLTVQDGGRDVKSSFTGGYHLEWTGEGVVFDVMWNFFGQKREGEDPGRGNTQVGLFW